jgi:hypothetical protein
MTHRAPSQTVYGAGRRRLNHHGRDFSKLSRHLVAGHLPVGVGSHEVVEAKQLDGAWESVVWRRVENPNLAPGALPGRDSPNS